MMKLVDPRALRHAVMVSVKMALFRLLFGFVKQLILKGNILRGPAKIMAGIETEIVSYNPLKWALFGGTMALYRPVQQAIEQLVVALTRSGKKRNGDDSDSNNSRQFGPGAAGAAPAESSANWTRLISSFLAGALVSLPTLKVFNLTTRTELTLYVAVRAGYSVLTEVVTPTLIPSAVRDRIPASLFNVVTMMLVSTSLLGCGTYHPDTHSTEYRNFLVNATTFASAQMRSLVGIYHDQGLTPPTATFAAEHGLHDVLAASAVERCPGSMHLNNICRIIHPQTPFCWLAFLQHCSKHLVRVSLPLYLPLKLITTLARGPAKLMKDPSSTVLHLVKGTVQSSLFLSLYVCGAYRAICFVHQSNIRNQLFAASMCGMVTGFALLLEPLERQADLVLFCSMHALRCTCLLLNKQGVLPRPSSNTLAATHVIAWALLFTFNEVKPDTLRGLFASMIKFFVGKDSRSLVSSSPASSPTSAIENKKQRK